MKVLVIIIALIFFQQDMKKFELSQDSGIKLPAHIKMTKRIKLTDDQINIADSLVNIYLKENHSKYVYTRKVDDYYKYYRQYVGYLSDDTKNTIFVNAFHEKSEYMTDDFLRKNLVFTRGGGSSFFNIKVNLKEGICYDLRVNAPK